MTFPRKRDGSHATFLRKRLGQTRPSWADVSGTQTAERLSNGRRHMKPSSVSYLLYGLGILAATAIGASPVEADSWALPTEVAVYSADKKFRLRVIPRELRG